MGTEPEGGAEADVEDEQDAASDDADGEELVLASRDWTRLEQGARTEGFREGRSRAEEDALQEGFDLGYRAGCEWGRRLGRLKGRLAARRVRVGEDDRDVIVALEAVGRELDKVQEGGDLEGLEQKLIAVIVDQT